MVGKVLTDFCLCLPHDRFHIIPSNIDVSSVLYRYNRCATTKVSVISRLEPIALFDGKVFGGFIRYNNDDFRSNFGDTADGKSLNNPEKYYKFAQDISDKLNIEYAGIDLLFDQNDNPILCEINSNAFFEEFEKVTHLNVAKGIAEMILRKMKEEAR